MDTPRSEPDRLLDYFALIERMGFELTVNDFSGLIVSDETQDARALLGVAGSELLRLYEGLEAQKGSLVVPEAARLSRERRLCLHAAEYLRRHLTLPVTAGEVASACHVSVSTLSHVFKRTIALSLRAYLLRFRLEAAKELLRAGRSVTDAALEAGFDDPNYFSRAFAQAEGVPPSRWNSGGNG